MSRRNPAPEEAAEQCRLALEIAQLGRWEYDVKGQRVEGDARCHELFALPGGPSHPIEEVLSVVHPDDRGRVESEIAAALAPGGPGTYDTEYKLLRRDDSMRFVVVRGRAVWSEEPGGRRAARVIGTLMDVTEQRTAEAVARESRELLASTTCLLQAISDNSTDAIFAKDLSGRMRFANPAALAVIGKPLEEVLGRTDIDLIEDKAAAREITENDRRVMDSGVATEVEERLPLPDGTARVWLAYKAPFKDASGKVVGLLGISRNITERKRAEEALREANEQLAEADRRKDEFIAILSHELRNPLAPIRYALPLLQRELVGPSATRAVAVIGRQLGHLTRLVDDLLDVSRITRGQFELHLEPVMLHSVLQAACEAAGPTIAAARHVMRIEAADEPVWLLGDSARLAQVLTNLLDNSAKYTPRGGEIVIEARRENGHAVIRVRDNGIGIPPSALPGVFEMFRQVNRPDNTQEGLGIGLALVKRLVEMHGGTIDAFSAGVGQGAEFVVRLPLAAEGTEGHAAAAAARPLPTGRRLKVLVVDDNADLVEMLATLISALGHDVRKSLDGRSAVSAARVYRPDVVLLDLGLPVMDGIEVARELKRMPETARARVIALTGWGQAEDRRQTREAGFDDHLTKPTDPGTLERLLADAASSGDSGR